MKKILFVTASLARNGTETFIMNVFRTIDRTKYMFDFLVFSDSVVGYYNEAKELGATIYRLPKRKDGFWIYKNYLDDFFKKNSKKYIALHWCGCSLTSILPIYYAKKYGIQVRIIHSHNSNVDKIHSKILHSINKLFLSRLATTALACSDVAAKFFFTNTKFENKYLVLKNGIDLNRFQYNPELRLSTRTNLGISSEFVIGHIGRFTKVKNHSFIIDVFYEVQKVKKDAMLLLIGVGETMDIVKEKVNHLGLQDYVLFLGLCENTHELLQAMDCFLFPSLYEGLPFALLEAQASGLPVYTSTNVSAEVDITNNVSFISLDTPANKWGKIILSNEICRTNVNEKIVNNGYSINDTVKILERIYG